MTLAREPVTTLFSALTTTMDSPFSRRFAITLAARPRTSPLASTTVGPGAGVGEVSGKESYPLSVGFRLDELVERERGAAGGMDLRPGLGRVGERPDGQPLRQRAVREQLARDRYRLVRRREPVELPDVQRHDLVARSLEPFRHRLPDRSVVGPGGAAELYEHPEELGILLTKTTSHGRKALDPGA